MYKRQARLVAPTRQAQLKHAGEGVYFDAPQVPILISERHETCGFVVYSTILTAWFCTADSKSTQVSELASEHMGRAKHGVRAKRGLFFCKCVGYPTTPRCSMGVALTHTPPSKNMSNFQ